MAENEAEAIRCLRAIARVEQSIRTDTGRYAFLDQILDPESNAIKSGGMLEWVDPERFNGEVFIHSGYCHLIYLVDSKGRGLGSGRDGPPVADFWLAYAWPEEAGVTGRRIFVADSHGTLRSWDNQLWWDEGEGTFTGARNRPEAHLATAPEDLNYPVKSKRSGWMRSLRWKPVPPSPVGR